MADEAAIPPHASPKLRPGAPTSPGPGREALELASLMNHNTKPPGYTMRPVPGGMGVFQLVSRAECPTIPASDARLRIEKGPRCRRIDTRPARRRRSRAHGAIREPEQAQ